MTVQVSTDPGRYLCDFIYFCSLAEAQRRPGDETSRCAQVLFMHVPPPGEPHSLHQMTESIKKVVSWIVTNHIAVD